MTTAVTSASRYLAPLLLGLSAALAAGNWYLRPERANSWAMALVFIASLALVLWTAIRRPPTAVAERHSADSIRSGIVWATLIIAVSLSVKLVQALGAIDDPDASKRLTMVMLGAFFVFTGNAMPKMLTPLSVLRCDGAKTQAVQRFAGWTFVLTGLAFAAAWLVLPPDVAEPVSVAFIFCAGLAVMVQAIRQRRTPRTA
jgi:uncharacterized membrane protein